MPGLPGLKVIQSSIDGYGVIAERDFAEGEVLAEVDGILRHEDQEFDDTYSLLLEKGWLLDMVDQNRWINHSCDPNCEVEAEYEGPEDSWACITAIRPIRAGEEITYDYCFSAELAEPCRCGASICRGYIVDPDELSRVAKTRS